ncbi:hypothetical protein Bca4012_018364 [Brassica carinata]
MPLNERGSNDAPVSTPVNIQEPLVQIVATTSPAEVPQAVSPPESSTTEVCDLIHMMFASSSVKFLCIFNVSMAQTNADNDLKSKSLQAEFASVDGVGDKQEELWSQFQG